MQQFFHVTPFELRPLPYKASMLEPYISAQTLTVHHEKHHQTYVDNLNKFVNNTGYAKMKSLSQIIIESARNKADAAQFKFDAAIFNNASQCWNHTFYWHSIKKYDGKPSESMLTLISAAFGSLDGFFEAFQDAALSQFGSGWTWLVLDPVSEKLFVTKTGNADNPMTSGLVPILTLDVWEHAYYLDYQNRRAEYVNKFLHNFINWDFAQENLVRAQLAIA